MGSTSDFTEPVTFETETDTTYQLDDLTNDTQYWWKVYAENQLELGTWSDETWSFTTHILVAPDTFSLLGPEDGATIQVVPMTFEWAAAFDPDAGEEDFVYYTLYISADEDFTEPFEYDADTNTELEVEENLEEDVTYWWKVSATDGETDSIMSNQAWSFSIDEWYPPYGLEANLDDETGIVNLSWLFDEGPQQDRFMWFTVYRDSVEIDRPVDSVLVDTLTEEGIYTYMVTTYYQAHETEACEPVAVEYIPNSVTDLKARLIPDKWSIVATYPNPFNLIQTVVVGLPQSSKLTVSVINTLGQEIDVLTDEFKKAGLHSFTFDGSKYSSGIYFVNAIAPGNMNEIRKIVLMK
ncbi:MAG: T9SS type A sorting domain-containing protein [Candidatus Electryonea clarkiae]|nr:T9SS type A sorting domain-containing protein [Candidatus Electryonea clarkiae]MDP8285193.1 T9SS type A sorting domain-containing protein [Candidatus Electryonea clarkiae]